MSQIVFNSKDELWEFSKNFVLASGSTSCIWTPRAWLLSFRRCTGSSLVFPVICPFRVFRVLLSWRLNYRLFFCSSLISTVTWEQELRCILAHWRLRASSHHRPSSVTGAISLYDNGPVKCSFLDHCFKPGFSFILIGQKCSLNDEDLEHGTCFQVGLLGVI